MSRWLTEEERASFKPLKQGEGKNWKLIKGGGSRLSELAWGSAENHNLCIPGMEWDSEDVAFFAKFAKAVGFKNFHAGVMTLNAPPTAVHVDDWTGEGNRADRWTALFIYRDGEFTGGEYTLTEEGVALDLEDGDVVLVRTNVLHANLPRYGTDYRRLAVLLCGDFGDEA